MRRIGSVAALAAVVALALVAGCTDEGSGGGRGRPGRTDDVGPAVAITTPPTSAPETTPATTERPRPSGPTTTLDPESQAVADFVELFAAGDLRALTLLEPLSPAYVWVAGAVAPRVRHRCPISTTSTRALGGSSSATWPSSSAASASRRA